jgi:tetratricopeptide (TPR) repeat protein
VKINCVKYLLFFATLNLFQHITRAQTKQIDSLKEVLRTAKEDTNKANTLNSLAREFRNSNPDTSVYFAKEALLISEKNNFNKGIAESYLWMGTAITNLSKYNEAISCLLKALAKNNDKKTAARIYINIGTVYYYQGNYPLALKNYFSSLKIKEEMGDKKGIANAYIGIGNVYSDQGNFADALKNHLACLKIRKETGDKNGSATAYTNIGIVFWYQGNYPEALKNHFASLKLKEETGDNGGIATAYNNIGLVYENMGNYTEALKNHLLSLAIKEQIKDNEGIVTSNINIGSIYKDLKQYKVAEEHFLTALKLSQKINFFKPVKEIYKSLSQIYSATGRDKEALNCYKAFVVARDSLFNEENTKKTVQLEMQYEFDKKEAAAKLEQEKRDAVATAESRKQNIIIASVTTGLALILILAIVILRSLRINQKKNKIITEQKELVEMQKEIVEEKQKEILDSIRYAKRIQLALLPSEKYIDRHLSR